MGGVILWEESPDTATDLIAGEYIIGLSPKLKDIKCEICDENEAVMTTNYSNDYSSSEWRSVCFDCFNKRFKPVQRDEVRNL